VLFSFYLSLFFSNTSKKLSFDDLKEKRLIKIEVIAPIFSVTLKTAASYSTLV